MPQPVAVRCFLVEQSTERFIRIAFVFQPVEHGFCNNFGAAALLLTFSPLIKKSGL